MSAADIILTKVLPPIGCLISVIQNLSAIYGTYGRFKNNDIRGLYPLPFTIYLGIQQMWFTYGFFTNNYYLAIAASVGVISSTFCMFTIVACITTVSERVRITCIGLAILFLTMVVEMAAYFISPSQSTRNMVVGIFLDVYYCIWTGSPLMAMREVIKARSAAAYVFPLTLTVFFNCCVWTGWGIGIMDVHLIFTSVWGMVLTGIQLVLIAAFWKNDKALRAAAKAAAARAREEPVSSPSPTDSTLGCQCHKNNHNIGSEASTAFISAGNNTVVCLKCAGAHSTAQNTDSGKSSALAESVKGGQDAAGLVFLPCHVKPGAIEAGENIVDIDTDSSTQDKDRSDGSIE